MTGFDKKKLLLIVHFPNQSFDSRIDPFLELRFDLNLNEFFQIAVDDSGEQGFDGRNDFSAKEVGIDLWGGLRFRILNLIRLNFSGRRGIV